MHRVLFLMVLCFVSLHGTYAQIGSEFSHLRGARNIAWGQAAVAASDGAAAMHMNSAALGGISGYSLIAGNGQMLPTIVDVTAVDLYMAGAVLPGRLGVGATWSTFNMGEDNWSIDHSLLRLHGGYRVSEWLDVGLEAARYSIASEGLTRRDESNNIIGTTDGEGDEAYDIGLSSRAILKDLTVKGDAVTIGLQIVNLFDTQANNAELNTYGTLYDKTRHVRLGALWSIPLEDADASSLRPRFLFGAGATMTRVAGNSANVYPGITVGASVLDMVTLLFNYEEEIDNGEAYFLWYPVIRIGILTDLPVGEWLGLDNRLDVSLDYTFWEQQGETAYMEYLRRDDDWPREAWAIGIRFTP